MIEHVNELLEALIEDERFIPNVVKLMKKMYDELVSAGFSEESACRIVANFKATGN